MGTAVMMTEPGCDVNGRRMARTLSALPASSNMAAADLTKFGSDMRLGSALSSSFAAASMRLCATRPRARAKIMCRSLEFGTVPCGQSGIARSAMKSKVLALLAAAAVPAFADQCADEVKKIEAALASKEISSDERAEIEDMKNQAAQLCANGNTQEGLDVAAEAKAMLDID